MNAKKNKKSKITLAMIESDSIVEFIGVDAGRTLKNHLTSLGLLPGQKFKVIKNDFQSAFILKVKESRVALGKGMATKIIVKKTDE